MFELLGLVVAAGAAIGGFTQTRSFVKRRLRYVEAIQKASAPVLAGAAVTIAAAPIVAILPIVTGAAAIALGVGVGAGTHVAVRDIREGRDD